MIEREVKLSFPSAAAARTALLAAGASPSQPRRLQDDALYDTPEDFLRGKGCIVRVRTEHWPDHGLTTTLTVKGPVQPGAMKIREEHETRVDKGDALAQVLDVLGLRPWFRYQKYREEFSAPHLIAALDETPVGVFVELEGGEEAIHSMTASLHREPGDFILDSYYRLFLSRREEYRLTGPYMLFPTA